MRQADVHAFTPGLLLAALACAHPWLEHTMARHMGVELPALFLLGMFAAHRAGGALDRALAPWNAHGLPGLLWALCVTGFWMLPVALDGAVLHPGMALAKVVSLVLAGGLLRASWSAAGLVVQGFFVLNWFWMTLAAGLLYQEAPQQLCSVYLSDQQAWAGMAVVVWAWLGLGAWLWSLARSGRWDDEGDGTAPPPPRHDGGARIAASPHRIRSFRMKTEVADEPAKKQQFTASVELFKSNSKVWITQDPASMSNPPNHGSRPHQKVIDTGTYV